MLLQACGSWKGPYSSQNQKGPLVLVRFTRALAQARGIVVACVLYLKYKALDDKYRAPQQPVKGGPRCDAWRAMFIHHEPCAVTTPNIRMRKSRLVGKSP